ncbi:MAG: winged helix DNA-binding domain-containing protein [Bacteroidetes bacterium]|nr:winged helix DNA-binding domain-containing protein [Bacteroidota bacterium]
MNVIEISNIRLLNQRIENTEFGSPNEVVRWMGAMQAQDYSMAKWAVGIRLIHSTEDAIENALNRGEILRTHVMRPTWHFVSADDIYWLLELTAPKVKSLLRSRHKELELTDAVHDKTAMIIGKAMSKGVCLTGEELSKEFAKADIVTDGNRLYHLLLYAELNGLICSGPVKDKKQTYALLRERVPLRKVYTRDESLAELAKRYFSSHGPATIPDFAWWSGLSVKDAGMALEFVKAYFVSETIDSKKYWFAALSPGVNHRKTTIHLLPAFDEFLISYKDRSASLTMTDNKKIISDNGIFRPAIVINGQVSGLWKCSGKNKNRMIEINYLQPQGKPVKNQTTEAAIKLGAFLGDATQISFKSN